MPVLEQLDCDHPRWGRVDRDSPYGCLSCGEVWPDLWSECQHTYANRNDGRGLRCTNCGAPWPADPAFPPAPDTSRNPGYGALRDQPGWNRRVAAMVRELDDVAA